MLNPADLGTYNQLLTQFAIEHGSGGAFVLDLLAPPCVVDTQSYAVPHFTSALVKQGKMQTGVGPDGKLNERPSIAPTFESGKCERRGLKSFTLDEIKAQPHGDLFASEEVELADLIDDLKRENEIAFKAILDAQATSANHHTSPTVKWDAAGFTNVRTIEDIEEAVLMAEIVSGRSAESGNWKLVIEPAVAGPIKAYLRTILKYTDGQFTLGGKVPSVLAGVPVIIPGAMQDTAKPGQTASVSRIWNTDNVYLIYVDPSFSVNRRSFTAFAQMRWNAVSPSYAAYTWRCDDPTCKRTHVATDIYDKLETLSLDGLYILDNVLT